jgi:hypothetical protein
MSKFIFLYRILTFYIKMQRNQRPSHHVTDFRIPTNSDLKILQVVIEFTRIGEIGKIENYIFHSDTLVKASQIFDIECNHIKFLPQIL